LVAAAKFLVATTKKLFVVPNYVAVTKPFFPVYTSVILTIIKWTSSVMLANTAERSSSGAGHKAL